MSEALKDSRDEVRKLVETLQEVIKTTIWVLPDEEEKLKEINLHLDVVLEAYLDVTEVNVL